MFFAILREWTAAKQRSTGTTADFIALAEERAGWRLGGLFVEWLAEPQLPKLPHRRKDA